MLPRLDADETESTETTRTMQNINNATEDGDGKPPRKGVFLSGPIKAMALKIPT